MTRWPASIPSRPPRSSTPCSTELTNWTRWGPDDERGTLHFLTDERRAAAAGLVSSGQSISLAHDLATEPMPDHPHPVQHHMLASGDARDSNGIEGYEAARDHLALDIHGLWTTHVDALSHMFVRGLMYGGRPASEVRSDGARANTVLSMADGVIGRGVLLDVPRALGVDVPRRRRGGHGGRPRSDRGPPGCAGRPGRRPAGGVGTGVDGGGASAASTGSRGCTPSACHGWPSGRWPCSAATGSRTRCPSSARPEWPFPVHQIGIVAMGLPLIDNVRLAPLGERCAESGRWEFLFTMAPLRIPKGTGCPVNPVAVL